MRACAHVHMHVCVRERVCVCVCVHAHACMRACVRVCMRVCTCVHVNRTVSTDKILHIIHNLIIIIMCLYSMHEWITRCLAEL